VSLLSAPDIQLNYAECPVDHSIPPLPAEPLCSSRARIKCSDPSFPTPFLDSSEKHGSSSLPQVIHTHPARIGLISSITLPMGWLAYLGRSP